MGDPHHSAHPFGKELSLIEAPASDFLGVERNVQDGSDPGETLGAQQFGSEQFSQTPTRSTVSMILDPMECSLDLATRDEMKESRCSHQGAFAPETSLEEVVDLIVKTGEGKVESAGRAKKAFITDQWRIATRTGPWKKEMRKIVQKRSSHDREMDRSLALRITKHPNL